MCIFMSRWSIIAQQLPGRTDNEVKNYWNTKLKKKLKEMGIDHVTHKPFSQILADYGNINGLAGSEARPVSLNRPDIITNSFIPIKPEQYQYNPPPLSGFSNNNISVDLLSQLQTIKLVTESSNCYEIVPPRTINEGGLLSSSSSTCSTAGQDFSWQDFLLEDAFLSPDSQQQEQDNKIGEHLSDKFTVESSNNGVSSHEFGAQGLSFVEAMIERENQMLSQFPDHLLEEPFYSA